MEPYQQRAVEEHREVVQRRQKLAAAINNVADFNKFPGAEQERMKRQLRIMVEYEGVLQERIDHFPK
jgi:hypothetical protein